MQKEEWQLWQVPSMHVYSVMEFESTAFTIPVTVAILLTRSRNLESIFPPPGNVHDDTLRLPYMKLCLTQDRSHRPQPKQFHEGCQLNAMIGCGLTKTSIAKTMPWVARLKGDARANYRDWEASPTLAPCS
jgi:hypothetical protein